MNETLRIETINDIGSFEIVLNGQKIPYVAAYTLQEGDFGDPGSYPRVYTKKLTLELWLPLTCELEVLR